MSFGKRERDMGLEWELRNRKKRLLVNQRVPGDVFASTVHVKKQAHHRRVAVWSPDNFTRDCGELAYRQDGKGVDMAIFTP
jgi:hypothetical protein